MNIHQQIKWVARQIECMETALPQAVTAGRLTQDHADRKLAAARATLSTLEQLRNLTHGKE